MTKREFLDTVFALAPNEANKIMDAFDEYVESNEPHWIPCSAGLPKTNDPVNVTWVNHNPEVYYMDIKDKPYTATAIYFRGKWFWYSSTTEDVLMVYGRCDFEEFDEAIKVLAWMPLPEPWIG